jgi:hypothetical protein
MTNLAMLSPSTRALHHGRKERPIRTHEIVLTDASVTVPGASNAGRARTSTGGAAAEGDAHHVGFSASGGDAAAASAVAPEAEAFSLATAATGGSAGRLNTASRRASAAAAAGGAAPPGGAAAAPERRVVPASALEFLTQERWAELDWDANGEISFREWVHAFLSWAEVDEEEDGDEEAEGAAGEGPGENGAGGGSADSLTALEGAAAAAIEADNRAVKSVDGVKLTLLTAE